MPLILGIDSSTSCGSVSLLKDGIVIGLQQYNIDKSHSSLLHVMIDQMIKNAGFEMKDIDAVAIAEGPGSYTGLRIGVSTAKGLCFSLDIPLIAVNTLEALAYQVHKYNSSPSLLCPMLDARRMEVYAMLIDGKFEVVKPTAPVVLEEYAFEDVLESNSVLFFGDGSEKSKQVINHENAVFIDHVLPSAQEVALLGQQKYDQNKFENVVSFEPFYLKEFRTASSFKSQ